MQKIAQFGVIALMDVLPNGIADDVNLEVKMKMSIVAAIKTWTNEMSFQCKRLCT